MGLVAAPDCPVVCATSALLPLPLCMALRDTRARAGAVRCGGEQREGEKEHFGCSMSPTLLQRSLWFCSFLFFLFFFFIRLSQESSSQRRPDPAETPALGLVGGPRSGSTAPRLEEGGQWEGLREGTGQGWARENGAAACAC